MNPPRAVRCRCLRLALALILILPLPAAVLADPIRVPSPDRNRTWAQAEEVGRQFAWDAGKGRFRLFLTYSNVDDASRIDAPQTETLAFSFPGVTWDAGRRLFVAAGPGGRAVPVARRTTRLFVIPQIELLPGNRAVVRSSHGEVAVSLEIEP